jgi:hypothetical protein
MKESRSKIKIQIYDSEIILIKTDDINKSCEKVFKQRKWKDKYDINGGDAEGCFLFDHADVGFYHIVLPVNPSLILILHETLHAAFIILAHHDVVLTVDNHEALTYLHGHIFEQVLKRTKK